MVVLLCVDVPRDIALARWSRNRVSGAGADVREEDLLNVVRNFEPPAPDEDALRVDGAQTAAAWVERYAH